MKKVLVLLFPTFSEFEVTVAASILRESCQLVTVGLNSDLVSSEAGLQFVPHTTVSEIHPNEYEAMLIPGGDMVYLKDADPLFDLVRKLFKQNKLLAAICSGG